MIRNRCMRCGGKMPFWYRFTIFLSCPDCIEKLIAERGY